MPDQRQVERTLAGLTGCTDRNHHRCGGGAALAIADKVAKEVFTHKAGVGRIGDILLVGDSCAKLPSPGARSRAKRLKVLAGSY